MIKKILANSWMVLFMGLFVAGSGYLYLNRRRTASVTPRPAASREIPSSLASSPEPTPADFSSPVPKKLVATSSPAAGGITRGRITCSYLIPATPDSQGTARLDADWNNLASGTNGKTRAAVCVSVNGAQSGLMSVMSDANGSTSVSVPWISLTADYSFQLFDQHGGDLPDCTGVILSACRINTKSNL
jgi:hypothetical protein